MDKTVAFLKSEETQKWIKEFLKGHVNNARLNDTELTKLKEIIDKAQEVYNYSGEDTGISDSDYDILYEKYDMATDNAGITVPVISGKIGYHKYKSLRGTLDKIYYLSDKDNTGVNKSRRGLDEWISTCEKKIKEKTGKKVNLKNEDIYVFPKWDGVSCIFEFNQYGKLERALTRGFTETNEAQVITHLFEDWVYGPIENAEHEYGLKTEIMMSEDDLESYNAIYGTNYKNSRSIVSSIMNSDEKDARIKYLQIMELRTSYLDGNEESLQTLAPGAFNHPYIKCKLKEIEKIEEFAKSHKYVNGLRCDGAVIYIINEEIQKILGRENNKQKFEVAYKFTEEVGYSIVKDIKFTIGLFGSINPILVIKPIKLKGNTIENISLGSYARFKQLRIAKGDTVKVLYDIIPYAVMDETCIRSGGDPIQPPVVCPDCGEPLMERDSGNSLYCGNKKCPAYKKGRILNYLNKMYIDGISFATVDILYENGYLKKIEDIYKLKDKKKEIEKLPGFGKQSVKILLDAIEKSRTVYEAQFLGALGIESISTKTFELALSQMTYNDLLNLCNEKEETAVEKLSLINGIGKKKGLKMIEGLNENMDLILKLEEELDIIRKPDYTKKYKVCFTRIRDEEKEKFIWATGGEVSESLTKSTDILVVPVNGVESSKIKKAKKWGIRIVPIDDLEAYITEHYVNEQ